MAFEGIFIDKNMRRTDEGALTPERVDELLMRVNQGYPDYSPLNGAPITGDMTIGEMRQILLAARLFFRG